MLGVNPAAAFRVLKTLLDVWDVAAEKMLQAVTRRLARGIDSEGWAEIKAREVLAVRAELLAITAQLADPELAISALQEAYEIGERAAALLGQSAIQSNPAAVTSLASRLTAQLQGSIVPVIRAHEDVFQRAVGDSELLMRTGTITRREAVAESVDRLLAEGVDRFPDSAGRRWHLDSYVRMAGRTMAGQAAVEGQLDGMTARGRDLVVISDSPRECKTCAPWESKLLSVTGTSLGQKVDGRMVSATVAAARAAGLWHPNCTHRADPYVSGLTEVSRPDRNPDGYAQTQKLRRLEREVRELKRRRLAAEQLGETATARALRQKIRAKHAQIAAHADASGLLRRRERERPVGG